MRQLQLTHYNDQKLRLPDAGRHIIAQYDNDSIVVYQAYRPAIGHFAAQHGYFGGEFSLSRMSWIKTSFLWMMYRCGWGTKANQEVVLAIWLRRDAFEDILRQAVLSIYNPDLYASEAEWKQDLHRSKVRLQWDPDRSPRGGALERRAIQLGLRGPVLAAYSRDWLLHIEDISVFVKEMRQHVIQRQYDNLKVPKAEVYLVSEPNTVSRMDLTAG